MAIGTGIALLPERTYAFALAKLPEAATGAATTTGVALLLVLWLSSAPLLAQHEAGTGVMLPRQERARRADARRDGLHLRRRASTRRCRSVRAARPTRCAASCGRRSIRARPTRKSFPTSSRSYGGQQFLRSPIDKGFNRLAWLVPVRGRRHRPRRRRHDRATLVAAARRRRGRTDGAKRSGTSKNASTMSSETSTETVRLKADAADAPRKPDASTLEPWQFFVLAALGCATAALFASRGQGVTAIVLLTVLMGATALVGIGGAAHAAAARVGRRRSHGDDRPADARRARAREDAGAAIDQGARVRSRDGEAVRYRLAGDVGPAARARGAPDAAARRRQSDTASRSSAIWRSVLAQARLGTRAAGAPRSRPVRVATGCDAGATRPAARATPTTTPDARFCKECGQKL